MAQRNAWRPVGPATHRSAWARRKVSVRAIAGGNAPTRLGENALASVKACVMAPATASLKEFVAASVREPATANPPKTNATAPAWDAAWKVPAAHVAACAPAVATVRVRWKPRDSARACAR